MAASTAKASDARRSRGRVLIALFTTTAALAGGTYALAPASAAAFQDMEEGCTEAWDGVCVPAPEGDVGGAAAGDDDWRASRDSARWQEQERQRELAEELRRKRDEDESWARYLEVRAQNVLRLHDPDGELRRLGECDSKADPLRCGVFWTSLAQHGKCDRIGNEPPGSSAWVDRMGQCRASENQLSNLLQDLVHRNQVRKRWQARKLTGK